MNEVDKLIELLEQFRGHKLDTFIRVLTPVGNSMFPEDLEGHLEFCDSSASDKVLKLEFRVKEDLTRVD